MLYSCTTVPKFPHTMPKTTSPSLGGDAAVLALILLVLSAWGIIALALVSDWARSWLFSGCLAETWLLLSGPLLQSNVPPWVLVFCLNALYAVASTSWLLHIIFTIACWPLVLVTSIAQYALISSFTRGRLRWLLHQMHFHRDKVAFFSFPVLIIDTGISGFVALHGVTASLLTLSIEFHSIDFGKCTPSSFQRHRLTLLVALNIGKGHEIHVHTDSLEIRLFRRIAIGEIYAAHKCLEDEREPAFEVDDDTLPTQVVPPGVDESRIVEDNVRHEVNAQHRYWTSTDAKIAGSKPAKGSTRTTVLDDEDAASRYAEFLNRIRTSGGLYQTRERLTNAHKDGEYTEIELIELRAMLCTELRRTGLTPPEHADRITTSKLATMFPEPNVFEYVPSAMRALLWLASHTHTIDCPSISVAGSGHWLHDLLSQFIFRHRSTDDQRIRELEREIAEWLSVGEYCVDLADITALGQVPLRSMYNIKSEIRSTSIAVSRVDVESDTSTQIASLAGVDGTFVIPICLLPNHSHLVPPEPTAWEVAAAESKRREAAEKREQEDAKATSPTTKPETGNVKQRSSEDQSEEKTKEEEVDLDALGVLMSIRVTLPAHFDESILSFAATLSKAAQMLDIEESFVDPPTPTFEEDLDPMDNFREKFSKRSKRLGSAMKHPLQTAHGAFHREMRKATVMRVNGAWFAKWTNKILEQLAWLNGDVGYTFEIPVSLKPYR
jgi:hypothetical protein